VTIPGKGGRPRKWRSDVDRSRAYRARQRGEAEPSTVEHALVDGDDLARARHEIEQLAMTLANREAQLTNAMFEYLETVHNRQRCNSSLGMVSPIEYERRHADNPARDQAS
jgi:hypothetical protein